MPFTFSLREIRDPVSMKSYRPSATKCLMNSRAGGNSCTSSKMTRDLRSVRVTPNMALRYRKKESRSPLVSSSVRRNSSPTLVKSTRAYELYSLRANSSAMVDLPTRRAPSINMAV